jgi:hypothetical protein
VRKRGQPRAHTKSGGFPHTDTPLPPALFPRPGGGCEQSYARDPRHPRRQPGLHPPPTPQLPPRLLNLPAAASPRHPPAPARSPPRRFHVRRGAGAAGAPYLRPQGRHRSRALRGRRGPRYAVSVTVRSPAIGIPPDYCLTPVVSQALLVWWSGGDSLGAYLVLCAHLVVKMSGAGVLQANRKAGCRILN